MRYGIVGASGRMGREIAALFERAGHELVLAVDEHGMREDGTPQLVVDFSLPPALPTTLELCRRFGAALVIGTTGFDEAEKKRIRALSEECAVVYSANFGIGINLLAMILADYADLFADWELEIVEAHHNRKKDAPSGTALMLMEATGRTCPTHALRLGNLPGDHAVVYGREDELLTFSHRIVNRSLLAVGALRAAEFAHGAAKGWYTFQDVLRAARRS